MFKMLSTITLLGLATISGAYAQSSQAAEAKIPFAFTVHDKTLAAGNYRLTYITGNHVLFIRGLDRHSGSLYTNVLPASVSESSNGSGRLVFHCYGRTCYFAQMLPGSGAGWEVLQPKRRPMLAMRTRAVSIAIPVK